MKNKNFIYTYPERVFRVAFEKCGSDENYDDYFHKNNYDKNIELMNDAISQLSRKRRTVIEEYFKTDKSFVDIANEYMVSSSKIYSIYYSALKHLILYIKNSNRIMNHTSSIIFNNSLKDTVNIDDLLKHKLITSRMYNALRFYYKYIDSIEDRIDDECKNIPQIKELLINKPSECNVRFIKFLFYATAYNKPLICMVRNLGKDSISILADVLGYQRGSSREIDSLIHADSNKIKYNNISSKMENLKAEINDLDKIDNKYIDQFLSKLDELKNLIESKRK